jgi:hypothetical protein
MQPFYMLRDYVVNLPARPQDTLIGSQLVIEGIEPIAEFAERLLADARGSVTCCGSVARFRAATVRPKFQAAK